MSSALLLFCIARFFFFISAKPEANGTLPRKEIAGANVSLPLGRSAFHPEGRDVNSYSLLQYFPSNECALLLKEDVYGSQGPSCITYGDISNAFLRVYDKLSSTFPLKDSKEPHTGNDFSIVAEYVISVTAVIAEQFSLSYHDIYERLPEIDTSKTLISSICPREILFYSCGSYLKYRSITGICNNERNPYWGAAASPQLWFVPLNREDRVSAMRQPTDLPHPRQISTTFHEPIDIIDVDLNWWFLAIGQAIAHDVVLTPFPSEFGNYVKRFECCGKHPRQKSPYCHEIYLSPQDLIYSTRGIDCLDMYKSLPGLQPRCALGPRLPANFATSYLDLSIVYGFTEEAAKSVREFHGGRLKMLDFFRGYGLKPLLAQQPDNDRNCIRPHKNVYCFLAGDARVNQNIAQVTLHTILFREHNRIAFSLGMMHPEWSEEILFQETRKIMIAQWQHIVYNEFLPLLLNKEVRTQYGLNLDKAHYWNGYRAAEPMGVWVEFAHSAFRMHSKVPKTFQRWNKHRVFIASHLLEDLLFKPFSLYEPGALDQYSIGMSLTPAYASDEFLNNQLHHHLFQDYETDLGFDLVSFNIQRGREIGLRGFMDYRKFCGLWYSYDWFEVEKSGIFRNETMRKLYQLYKRVEDIEFWTGGISEIASPNSAVGPTFACIIGHQFSTFRKSDRHWYELPWEFTLAQLNELRKVTLARWLCDNLDDIETTEVWSMLLPNYELNPQVSCRTNEIPEMDLSVFF